MSQAVLNLPPDGRAFETVAIRVPKIASAGERYGVVWAEASAPPPVSGGVRLVNRVGVRMYVSVGSGGLAPTSFTIGSLSAGRSATGGPLVVAIVRNTSKRTLDIRGALTLSNGPGGLRAGPFPIVPAAGIAPNGAWSAKEQLDKRLPIGPWHVQMLLRSGDVERKADATLSFPRLAPAASPSHSPLLLIVAALLIGATLIMLANETRRRHPGRRAASRQ